MLLQRVGRPCSICTHPDRHAIDLAIVDGKNFGAISIEFDVNEQAVGRHARAHIAKTTMNEAVEKKRAVEQDRVEDLVARARGLQGSALAIARKAEASGQLGTAISGLREVGRLLELQAKLMGQLRPDTNVVNVLIAPQFQLVQQTILCALQKHPAARADVIAALERLG